MGYKKRKIKSLYIYSTLDKYEFPIYIEDSLEALAKKCGITKKSLNYLVCRSSKGHGSRYHRVKYEEGE